MLNLNAQKSLINDANFKYYGIDTYKLYVEAGQKIGEKLIQDFGINKSYVFVCGLGGNAGDAFSTVIYLINNSVKNISLYLIGRPISFKQSNAQKIFDNLIKIKNTLKYDSVLIKQDCYANDIKKGDIVVEALIGTGFQGTQLNKRFKDVINRISHFSSILIAIDSPVPGYKPDKIYSIIYPKKEDADIITLNLPKDISLKSGPGDVKYLFKSKSLSHKSKNGKILFICSTKITEDIKLLINITKEYNTYCYIYNFNQLQLKEANTSNLLENNYSLVNDEELISLIDNSDLILIGKFDKESLLNKGLLLEVLKFKEKKLVMYSNSIDLIDIKDLYDLKSKLVVLNKIQTNSLTQKISKSDDNVSMRNYALQNNLNIVNLGLQTIMYSQIGEFKSNISSLSFNSSYNILLTCLIATIGSKNELWDSIKASIFILELAFKMYFDLNTSDIQSIDILLFIKFIHKAIDWCIEY